MSKKRLQGSIKFSLEMLKSLSQFYQNEKTYNKDRVLVDKIGEDGKVKKFLELNFSIWEEGNFGNNVTFVIPQSKEQIANKEKPRYVSNGRIFSASEDLLSFVQKPEKKEDKPTTSVAVDDLPF
jgi:hypothetical protein